jgi:hypothetical protein
MYNALTILDQTIVEYKQSNIITVTGIINGDDGIIYNSLQFIYKGSSILLDRSPDSWVLLTSSSTIIPE